MIIREDVEKKAEHSWNNAQKSEKKTKRKSADSVEKKKEFIKKRCDENEDLKFDELTY